MTEASYTAWDGNLYEWPPPDGWYEAADGKWWPDGYGPSSEDGNGHQDPVIHTETPIQALNVADPGAAGVSSASGEDDFEPLLDASPAGDDVGDHDGGSGDDEDGEELPNIDDVFGGVNIFADDEDDQDEDDYRDGNGTHGANAATDVTDILGTVDGPPEHDANGDVGGAPAAVPAFDQEPAPSASAGFDDADEEVDLGIFSGVDEDGGTPDGFGGGLLITDQPAASGFDRQETNPQGPIGPAEDNPEHGVPGGYEEGGPEPASTVPGLDHPPNDAAIPADPYNRSDSPAPTDAQAQDGQALGDTLLVQVDDYQDAHAGDQLITGDGPGGPIDSGHGDGVYRRSNLDDGEPGAGPVWPLALAGVSVAVLVALLLIYLLFRGGGDDLDAGGAEPSDTTATGQGSLNQPYSLGTDVAVYYDAEGAQHRWVVKVLSPVVDGTEQLAESRDGTIGEGQVLAVSRVRLTYQSGPDPGRVTDLVFNAVGQSSTVYDDAANGCANVDEVLPLDAELAPTEFLEGNLCWQVAAEDLPSLKLAVEAEPAEGRIHLVMSQS